MLDKSAPTWFAKTPSLLEGLGFTEGIDDISVAQIPYALNNVGARGTTASNSAPSFLAIW
jgi:hypothetical protein